MKTNSHRIQAVTIAIPLLSLILSTPTTHAMEHHPSVDTPASAPVPFFRPVLSKEPLLTHYFMPEPEYAAHAICNAFYFLVDSFEKRSEQLASQTVRAMGCITQSLPANTVTGESESNTADTYRKTAYNLLEITRTLIGGMLEEHHTSAQESLRAFRLAVQTKNANIAHYVMTLLSQRHKNFLIQEAQCENAMIQRFVSLDGNCRPTPLASLTIDSRHLPIFESFEINLELKGMDDTLDSVTKMICPPDLQVALKQSLEARASATLRLVECIPAVAALSALCHKYGAKRELACDALATLLNNAKKAVNSDNDLFLFQLRSLMRPPSPHEPTATFTPANQAPRTNQVVDNMFSSTSAFQKAKKRQIADS